MTEPSIRFSAADLALPVTAMTLVVAVSNFAVQHPIHWLGLQDYLTWGAVTYPLAFLVNDLTNRRFGPAAARRVIYVGMAIAIVLSIWLATPRIALASGTAFLFGQLLDVSVFNHLRRKAWWRAPLFAGIAGSALDTAIFFSLAFAGVAEMSGPVAYGPVIAPLWAGLAFFDFWVKTFCALTLLMPYGALMLTIRPLEQIRRDHSA